MKSLVVQARSRMSDLRQSFKKAGLALWEDRRVMPEALPFLDDIEEIVEEPPPRFMRATLHMVVALFIAIIVVAAVLKVDVVVVGVGRLVTDTPPIMLQPLERSILREIKVKVGDQVKQNQTVATLDSTVAKADLASLQAQERVLLAQIRRLEAELQGKEPDFGAAPTGDFELQASLFRQRKAEYEARLGVFEEAIERLGAAIATLEDSRDSLANQLELAKDVETTRADLAKSQVGSRMRLLDAQAIRMRIQQNFEEAVNRLTELRHDVQSKRAERAAFASEWRRQTLDALVRSQADVAVVREAITKATLVRDLVQVTAPESGVVLEVARRSSGSVLREAEPLVSIIPFNATLIAEIMIRSEDVGYTRTGDPAVIKIDAFPYQRHGFLPGVLRSVSEDSVPISEAAGQEIGRASTYIGGTAFHRARVELGATRLDDMPADAHLIPGMTLHTEIKVGKRTILSYFLWPLLRSLGESLREP